MIILRVLFIFIFFHTILLANPTLMDIIAKAKVGSKIELPSGVFQGPITINKPLILTGIGKKSVIQNNNKGTVITITSPDVTISNLTIRGSGHQRYSLDSGIKVIKSSHVVIKNCDFNRTLFGIILQDSFNSKIINNTIKSYKEKVVDNRGDGIRLWGSHNNLISKNRLFHSRDISLNRSNNNTVRNNIIKNSRYGILINMCQDISVVANIINSNYAGIMLKGGKNIKIRNNKIIKTHLATGTGIMIKNGKNIHIAHNTLTGHAQAFYINTSTSEIGMQRFIEYNKIQNNNVAFHFYSIIKNNTIKYNNIIGNLEDVVKDIPKSKYYNNDIKLNFWDKYVGFDRNGDGISDMPYQVLIYADKLWQFDHRLKFFYGTPLLSIVDFIERLAPFSEPSLLLEDNQPKKNAYAY